MRAKVGQYRIEEKIGRGGMGVVFRGVHERLGRQVAIKALAPELTKQPEFRERFFSEAKTQASLQHPNIVGVHDLLEEDGDFFIVMEFVAGEGLDDQIAAAPDNAIEVPEALSVISQVLSALDHAHAQGVIHRDVKPSNVLVTKDGQVKFTDFGIALLVGDKRLTASQFTIGTPTYMSPEQILRPRSVDHRTDLYSTAVVFFELLAGRPPFEDDTGYGLQKKHIEQPPPDLGELNPALPPALVSVVELGLAKNPDDRFGSARLFLEALKVAVPDLPWTGSTMLLRGFTPPRAVPELDQAQAQTPVVTPSSTAPTVLLNDKVDVDDERPKGSSRQVSQGQGKWKVVGSVAVLSLLIGLLAVALGRGTASTEGDASQQASLLQSGAEGGPEASSGSPSTKAGGLASSGTETEGGSSTASSTISPAPLSEKAGDGDSLEQNRAPASNADGISPLSADAVPGSGEEESPAASGSPPDSSVERFTLMQEVLNDLVRLSEEAEESANDDDTSDDLTNRLDDFHEASGDVRRIFRKATGTGALGGLKKRFGRRKGSREISTSELDAEIDKLSRLEREVEELIKASSPSAATLGFWQQIRDRMVKLRRLR